MGEIAIHGVEDAKDFVQKNEELLSMAQTFDKKGARDIDLFIDYARRNQAGKVLWNLVFRKLFMVRD